jgi:N-glycosylase/DNA lyase
LNLEVKAFCLDFTLCCGQVFRWNKIGEWWYGVANDQAFKVRQRQTTLEFTNVDLQFIKNYFALNEDLSKIAESINKDKYIEKALKKFWGLRLIRQDPWECLLSYICATCKNIPAIKNMLNNLARKYGQKITFDGVEFYTLPKPAKLANITETDLMSCSLGYRAKYIVGTAKKMCQNNFELENLKKMPYSQAKKILMTFPGVGAKVADCVMLFSLDKLEAFPVDVWVKRVILNHYLNKLNPEIAKKLSTNESLNPSAYNHLNEFGCNYFGKNAGYAQEYLYHYERMHYNKPTI